MTSALRTHTTTTENHINVELAKKTEEAINQLSNLFSEQHKTEIARLENRKSALKRKGLFRFKR